MADYSEALQLDPRYKEAYTERGKAYSAKGDPDPTIADYNQAIELDPRFKLVILAAAPRIEPGATLIAPSLITMRRSNSIPRTHVTISSGESPTCTPALLSNHWPTSIGRWSSIPRIPMRRCGAKSLRGAAISRAGSPTQTAQIDMKKWPAPVVHLYLGDTTSNAMLAAADDPNPNKKKGQLCEANFFTGELALHRGSKEDAARLFGLLASDCPKNFIEWSAAKAKLKALGINP
jgi:tetratricopeptide (TPR) repeat protein